MKILQITSILFISIYSFAQKPKASKEEWIQLFNGKNLENWDIKIAGHEVNDNYKNTFRVEDGMLRISYDEYQTFDEKYGHIYYNKPFSYYKLRFEYRFTGNQTKGGANWNVRNSGVMFHSQSAQSNIKEQHFPISLEIQTLGGLGKGTRHTANLCTPGTQIHQNGVFNDNHCIDSKSKTYDGDQWITVEAIILGDSSIQHIIENEVVLSYEKPIYDKGFANENYKWENFKFGKSEEWINKAGMPLKEGYIALQAESHPIDFRKVELLNLKGCTDPKALNFKSYYLKSDNSECRYK